MSTSENERLEVERLKQQLIDVLEQLNKIKPIQFLDYESEYVYNFLDVQDSPYEGEDRLYIVVSCLHDNLPSHKKDQLVNGRGDKMLPLDISKHQVT